MARKSPLPVSPGATDDSPSELSFAELLRERKGSQLTVICATWRNSNGTPNQIAGTLLERGTDYIRLGKVKQLGDIWLRTSEIAAFY